VHSVYNGERYLAQAIELGSSPTTMANLELRHRRQLSTDGTAAMIARCKDPASEPSAMNRTSDVRQLEPIDLMVRGKYVKLLCADDFLYPDCLAVQTEILEDPANKAVAMVFCRRDIRRQPRKTPFTWGFSGRPGRWRGVDIIRKSIRAAQTSLASRAASCSVRNSCRKRAGSRRRHLADRFGLWSRLLVLRRGIMRFPGRLCAFRVSVASESIRLWAASAGVLRLSWRRCACEPKFHVSPWELLLGEPLARLANLMRLFLYKFVLR